VKLAEAVERVIVRGGSRSGGVGGGAVHCLDDDKTSELHRAALDAAAAEKERLALLFPVDL
jgi:hypothetical protein